MESTHKLWLLVNGTSGSHQQARIDTLCERLGEAGRAPARILDCCEHGLPARATLEAADVATLAVHGGDGTINGAVTALEGWGGQVLPLPGGTANLLCHRLYPDLELGAIVARFTAGDLIARKIACVTCEQGLAIAELVMGPGAKWTDVREDMRKVDVAAFVSDAVDAAGDSLAGPMVHITAPPRGRDKGYAGIRLVPSSGGFAIEGYGPETIGEVFAQGAALLARDFRQGPHERLGKAQTIACRAEEGEEIALMIDGERCSGKGTIQFRHRLLDLPILGLLDPDAAG